MKLPDNYESGKGIRKPTAAGGLGEALLRRMGWSEGQGLGANQSGIKEAIQVKFKDDLVGVRLSCIDNFRDYELLLMYFYKCLLFAVKSFAVS